MVIILLKNIRQVNSDIQEMMWKEHPNCNVHVEKIIVITVCVVWMMIQLVGTIVTRAN
jgi:hypothetical protein